MKTRCVVLELGLIALFFKKLASRLKGVSWTA